MSPAVCHPRAMRVRWGLAVSVSTVLITLVGVTPGIAIADDGDQGLSGDPSYTAQFWGSQNYDDCMMMAVADVVGQLTGTKPSEEAIVAVAESTPSGIDGEPIYKRGAGGSDDKDEPLLFKHYGIDAVFTNDETAASTGVPTGMPALTQNLRAGYGVTVAVNSQLIWGQDGDHRDTNHIVVVTGVDKGSGIVHLNDSGSDEGADEQVDIATFEQSWATSGHAMVVAY